MTAHALPARGELYEIPMGAVAVVAGVGANVLNVVLLGTARAGDSAAGSVTASPA